MKTFYQCDPELFRSCKKTLCQKECKLTTFEKYAKRDENGAPIVAKDFEIIPKIKINREVFEKCEEETETITVSKGCLKTRTGRFVVYDVGYLKSHIEQEAAIYGNVSAITGKTEDRPTGRWIDIQYFKNDDTYYRPKCPFCSIEPKEYSNFCPNCGARMTESEDKE